MKNKGLFSTLFIDNIGKEIRFDDLARGRMGTLIHTWKTHTHGNLESLWETFMKQALGYLQFVPGVNSISHGVYPLFED
ncbi:MAG: hypothetical protein JW902_05235, partial [Syntrophaceae bacterium]|nr:hypothetical protein [Syntrophaceae bacterium]